MELYKCFLCTVCARLAHEEIVVVIVVVFVFVVVVYFVVVAKGQGDLD